MREIEPGVFEVTAEPRAGSPLVRALQRLGRIVLGEPLSTVRERAERLTWIAALAVLGADSIASSLYGPEEMLRTLALAGPQALQSYALPLGAAIVVLLLIVSVSYWQTISAYPNGAGGYIVASDNLGRLCGLIAAGALLIDYTLDVAVSVAMGMQTATSTLPMLAEWRVPLALLALALITLTNLRGVRAAGFLFSLPIYGYIAGTAAVIGYGALRTLSGDLPPYTPPQASQEMLANPVETLGVLLVLRAFSSGAVALTGIEATSNGVPYLEPPEARNAHITLAALTVVFGAIFLGLSFLSGSLGIVPDPTETETVHSQLTRSLLGQGAPYIVLEVCALLLLILAADTGFADFPRLMALLANDGFLPTAFAVRGARLAYSNGIVLVAAISAVLIVAFRGSVAALVPLFTVGAFLTFTLSQAGMARRWWTRREPRWQAHFVVNAFGGVVTAIVLAIVLVSKFTFGAWIVVVVLPLVVLGLRAIGQHHDRLERLEQVSSAADAARDMAPRPRVFVVPVEGVDRRVLHAIGYARSVCATVHAVHVTDDLDEAKRLRQQWAELVEDVRLVVLESPYRAASGPLLAYLDTLDKQGLAVTVVIPELLPKRWWQALLHNYFAWRLKWSLVFRPNTAVVSVPYQVCE